MYVRVLLRHTSLCSLRYLPLANRSGVGRGGVGGPRGDVIKSFFVDASGEEPVLVIVIVIAIVRCLWIVYIVLPLLAFSH